MAQQELSSRTTFVSSKVSTGRQLPTLIWARGAHHQNIKFSQLGHHQGAFMLQQRFRMSKNLGLESRSDFVAQQELSSSTTFAFAKVSTGRFWQLPTLIWAGAHHQNIKFSQPCFNILVQIIFQILFLMFVIWYTLYFLFCTISIGQRNTDVC